MKGKTQNGEKTSFISRSTQSQMCAVFIKNLVLLGYGMSLAFPTILIPNLSEKNPEDTLYIDQEATSWIGSINLIVVPVGCLMSGVVTQPLGRRRSMQLINVPFCVVFLIYYFATQTWHIFLTLAITGLTGGLMEAPVLTYVAEISQPHLRGTLASTASVTISSGVMLQFILGYFLSWKSAALCNIIVPILSICFLFLIPETPSWLLSMKRYEEAKRSLAWLRGWVEVEDVAEEYEELLRNLRMKDQSKKLNIDNKLDGDAKLMRQPSVSESLRKRNFIKPYFLVSFACFLVHFCGSSPIQIYAVNIFATIHSPIRPSAAAAVSGIVGMLGSLTCVIIVSRCGRRVLAFVSLTGTAIAFCVLGTYMHLFHISSLVLANNASREIANGTSQSSVELSGPISWLPFMTIIIAGFSAHVGLRVLPWTLIGEVFPNDIRALAAGMVGMNFYLFGFMCNKTFFTFISLFTLPGTFWIYSSISALGVAVLYFMLPETEGKTLHEIVEHFSGNSKLGNSIIKKRTPYAKEENEQSVKLFRSESDYKEL